MKRFSLFYRAVLALLCSVTLVLLAPASYAAENGNKSNGDDGQYKVKAAKGESSELKEQYFPLDGAAQLKIVFRYKNDKLVGVYLFNTEKEPLQLEIFEQTKVLGDNDDWLIEAPNVDEIRLNVCAYAPHADVECDTDGVGKVFHFSKGDDGFFIMH